MIRVIVAQTNVRELSGVSSTTKKEYHLRFQTAYAETIDKDGNRPAYPEKFDIMLDRDQAPYERGEYTLHPSAVYVDRDGRLAISSRLTPVAKKATA